MNVNIDEANARVTAELLALRGEKTQTRRVEVADG